MVLKDVMHWKVKKICAFLIFFKSALFVKKELKANPRDKFSSKWLLETTYLLFLPTDSSLVQKVDRHPDEWLNHGNQLTITPSLFKVPLTFLIHSPRQRFQTLYALHWTLPLLTSTLTYKAVEKIKEGEIHKISDVHPTLGAQQNYSISL